jgi:RimJ/RimL family protein N-acetyltransferase
MPQDQSIVFETERFRVRLADETDIASFYSLWTDPQVMANVGFPQGLPITMEEMKEKPFKKGETVFDQLLVIELKENGEWIGECKLATPDEEGISEPDIKLLLSHWGMGYGSEIWSGLVSYQFNHTACKAVQTTPNVENTAAIRLYEAAGAVREGEDVYHFPDSMQDFTTPVHCYIYRLYRVDWQRNQEPTK